MPTVCRLYADSVSTLLHRFYLETYQILYIDPVKLPGVLKNLN